MNKRAGELTDDEVERVITIMQNPRQYKIPDWFLNRQKDHKDGKYSQVIIDVFHFYSMLGVCTCLEFLSNQFYLLFIYLFKDSYKVQVYKQ